MLRKELREKLSRLGPEERWRRSQGILVKLFSHPKFLSARSLLTYVALSSEVETRPVIDEAQKKGKKVYVPRADRMKKKIWAVEMNDPKELTQGWYGIFEPPFDSKRVVPAEDLDLVVVPGLGFDHEGGRLGRGEGYFDRFLGEAEKAYKIGLAFECQIVAKVPHTPQDVILDEVLIG